MSAPATAPPKQRRAKKSGSGWVKTPLGYFELSQILSYTQFVCMGVILRWTFGWDRASARISLWTFINTAGVSRQAVEMALAILQQKGLIRVIRHENGEREYLPDLAIEIRMEQTAVGKCGQRRQVTIFDLAQNFAYVPHNYFTQLPKCCDYAVFIVVGVIMAASMRWDRNQMDFTAIESSLSIEDLTRLTGFSARALQGALKTAHEKGLIAVKEVPGRSSFYSIIPEQFKSGIKLARKTARKLNRETSEPRANKNTAKTAQAVVNTNVTPAVELHSEKVVSIAKEFGRCRNCGAFGPIEPVKPKVAAAHIQNPQTRAGPGPAQTPQATLKPEPPQEQGRECPQAPSRRSGICSWLLENYCRPPINRGPYGSGGSTKRMQSVSTFGSGNSSPDRGATRSIRLCLTTRSPRRAGSVLRHRVRCPAG
jgi:hypothetical protein